MLVLFSDFAFLKHEAPLLCELAPTLTFQLGSLEGIASFVFYRL